MHLPLVQLNSLVPQEVTSEENKKIYAEVLVNQHLHCLPLQWIIFKLHQQPKAKPDLVIKTVTC